MAFTCQDSFHGIFHGKILKNVKCHAKGTLTTLTMREKGNHTVIFEYGYLVFRLVDMVI